MADYFDMLLLELSGQKYSKAGHNRGLQRVLDGRSRGSIEFKHQNVSAVLRDLGHPWIAGYKPMANYQELLFDAVARRAEAATTLRSLIETQVEKPASIPVVEDLLQCWVEPPKPEQEKPPSARPPGQVRRMVDYLARESANRSLGRAGEEFALRYERARLNFEQKPQLADRIEHTSVTEGDGAGFDIRSFEADGRDRLIEVKTTAYAKETPFYVSRNEVAVSQDRRDHYQLYRLFTFRSDPRLFTKAGALDEVFRLAPSQYLAKVG